MACSIDGPAVEDLASTLRPAIHLDGEFDDWSDLAPKVSDRDDAPAGAPVDIGRIWATDDPAWMYVSFEVDRDVNVQAMQGEMHLVIDTDGDPSTGGRRWGLDGADLELVMSRQDRPQPGGFGAGFGLRAVTDDSVGPLRSSYDLDVAALPTHVSNRFELRVARHREMVGVPPFGGRVRALLAASHEGELVDASDAWDHTFASPPGPSRTTSPVADDVDARIEAPPNSFRLATWNVSEGSFRDPDGHARILGVLRPDVILLDEVPGDTDLDDLAAFFGRPDLDTLGAWEFVLSEGGGRQKTVVAARDRAVRQEPTMVEVRYAAEALEPMRARVPEAAQRLLDAEAERHMSATGGWIEVDGVEVLFVPLDLQSAGYAGSPQDQLRVVQARTLAEHVQAAIGTGERRAPVVIAGDFNLVGSVDPLRVLSDALDTDGGALSRATLDRLGEATRTTWRGRGGPFAPGLLDMALFAEHALEQVGGFVFATDDLPDDRLESWGLERDLSEVVSDHLVLVVDLRVRPRDPSF